MQKQLSYSREDERQADQMGFKYMEKAGFDPTAMVQVLGKLQNPQWTDPQQAPSYLLRGQRGSCAGYKAS